MLPMTQKEIDNKYIISTSNFLLVLRETENISAPKGMCFHVSLLLFSLQWNTNSDKNIQWFHFHLPSFSTGVFQPFLDFYPLGSQNNSNTGCAGKFGTVYWTLFQSSKKVRWSWVKLGNWYFTHLHLTFMSFEILLSTHYRTPNLLGHPVGSNCVSDQFWYRYI